MVEHSLVEGLGSQGVRNSEAQVFFMALSFRGQGFGRDNFGFK